MKITALLFLLLVGFCSASFSQQKKPDQIKGIKESGVFKTDISYHLYDIILGRPTTNTITISIYASEEMDAHIAYGLDPKNLNLQTKFYQLPKSVVSFIDLENLKPNSKYYYQLRYKNSKTTPLTLKEINSFQTARGLNSDFVFTIQADSHLDENTSTEMYLKTLNNMKEDHPDFMIDLGDTWMTDKYRNNYKESYRQYLAQRYYFGTLGKSAPIFLTLGNHDGESGQQLKKVGLDNMTNWATQIRRNFYPNPFPNNFYAGNTKKENGKDFIENYYSWQWGDALFIVLDPFRFTNDNRTPWVRTLGSDQFTWLKKTLENSKAKFKFVFIHNLVGGVDNKGIARGGAEAAKLYEWGGFDANGVNTFLSNRPDWEMPIHNLLLEYKVNVVFHGHDHFFAKQDLDGIVYQLLPQPGAIRYGNTNSAVEYGYISGKILNHPGYLRVSIHNGKATVEDIQTSIDANHENKGVLYSYPINPKN